MSAIFLGVGSRFNFVTHSQNSPLKTSGRVVVIKNKWDHCFQHDQNHISGISTSWVWGNVCHISRGWRPFLFCHSQPEFAPENFRQCCCHQGQATSQFSTQSKAYQPNIDSFDEGHFLPYLRFFITTLFSLLLFSMNLAVMHLMAFALPPPAQYPAQGTKHCNQVTVFSHHNVGNEKSQGMVHLVI